MGVTTDRHRMFGPPRASDLLIVFVLIALIADVVAAVAIPRAGLPSLALAPIG